VKFQRFVEELQRRHVLRVAGGYLVASWFAIEVTSTVLPLMGRTEEGATWVLYAAIAGIPIMLLLAWFFDLTKQGIVRTPSLDAPQTAVPAVAAAGSAVGGGRVVRSGRATGMFGLGILVAVVSIAAYSQGWSGSTIRRGVSPDSGMASIESIGVLTFADMSEEHDQEYFAEGMTEELINRLAQVEGLRVISGRKYAGSRAGDIRAIGDALNVEAVLEGSVRRSRDSVRVSVNIIGSATDAVLFSRTFTRPLADVFKVQDEVAAAVAGALQLQRTSVLAAAEGTRGTSSELAFDLYGRGRAALAERTDADLRRAVTYFEDAIQEDPKFALAWAGLAQAYAVLPTVGDFGFEKAGTLGTQAAGQAIALDPTLGEASAALGQIMQNLGWDPGSAEVQYQRAIQFLPSDATAHQWYAETLTMLGRTDEALGEITRAIAQDRTPANRNTLGYVHTIRGEYDKALAVFRASAVLYPDYRLGHLTHALTALTAKQYGEAEQAAAAYAGTDMRIAAALSRVVRAAAGNAPHDQGVTAAASLEATMGPGFTALWMAALGENGKAMALVQKAYDQRSDANFPYFVIHPLLRPLHDNPSYKAIVTAMGVTPAP
jgi:TolB-like protein/Tfp pilus assembly protein PilF